ncbi:MAG TPA: universal stress protein [Anaeromyxobacter sp.]|nr:universal stress protein [Anaeromyxobacter sp.]
MAAMEWRRICCPVDHSEPAQAGLRVAADLCRRLGAELVLLHADAATKVAEELSPVERPGEQLQAWKSTAESLGAPHVTAARTTGAPEVAIVEFATASDIDLIVMGTHGRVDREHMLTGSVAEAVVRNAPCPVLTVRATWKA